MSRSHLFHYIDSCCVDVFVIANTFIKTTMADDQTIYTISKEYLKAAARSVIEFLAIVMHNLVIILHVVQRTLIQFVAIFLTFAVFVYAISIISKARITEIFMAGAVYAAVHVVFISSNGISPCFNNTPWE